MIDFYKHNTDEDTIAAGILFVSAWSAMVALSTWLTEVISMKCYAYEGSPCHNVI